MSNLDDMRAVAKSKLGLDLTDDPEYFIHLEFVGANSDNKSGKSNKFWQVGVFAVGNHRYVAVRRWGKYGTNGQCKAQSQTPRWTAINFAEDNEQKKRDKGYTKEVDIITRLATIVDEE